MKKAVLIVALVASFIAVFPLSVRVADPFFTYRFHEDWHNTVLLIWPDQPNGNASWTIHVKQLGVSRQEIRLELMGDGISGLIYEAKPDEIIPLRSRLGGPAGAFVILAANLVLWGAGWLFLWFVIRLMHRRTQSPPVSEA